MKIGLLTCAKFPDLIQSDQNLNAMLNGMGFSSSPVVWDDNHVDWQSFDYLVFRNTWDYFEKEAEFMKWLEMIQQLNIKTLNSIDVIKNNLNKFYLKSLSEKGVRIIDTCFLPKNTLTNEKNLLNEYLAIWSKAIIKPAFSAGSYLTEVIDENNVQNIIDQYSIINQDKDLLLQRFYPEISTFGETSFIFFNRNFSHAVNKKPKEDDFRVQSQYGGIYLPIEVDKDLIAQAQSIIDHIDGDLLYARVDGIVINGTIHLMEVELIEPDLYYDKKQGALNLFAKCIYERIHEK